jgi:hypothetical protein
MELDKFYQTWSDVAPELVEIGAVVQPIRLPAKIAPATLDRATQQLEELANSEALIIFRKARDLRPPGVLQAWANDKLTREARETQVYIEARKLLRTTWRELKTLRRLILRGNKDEN